MGESKMSYLVYDNYLIVDSFLLVTEPDKPFWNIRNTKFMSYKSFFNT